jgi:hypothetical protein
MVNNLLSQMEEIRKKKENDLKSKGIYSTLTIFGIISILICIFFIWVGLSPRTEGSVEASSSGSTGFDICYGTLGLLGIFGVLMVTIGVIRLAGFIRNMKVYEKEYQLWRSKLMGGGSIPQVQMAESSQISLSNIESSPPASDKQIWLVSGVVAICLFFLCALAMIALLIGTQGNSLMK